jgi:hypothetical protein
MYYRGTLTVDPKEMTKIQVVKPEGNFKKILFKMTGGKVGDKREVETFKAISILQQIYTAVSSVGVNNIVRINHDDIDIYYDYEGKEDDLNHAISEYCIEIDDAMSEFFKKLWLVLEHEDRDFKYLIEISVNRSHEVNKYPIEVLVSGLLKNASISSSGTKEELKTQMGAAFNSQDEYDTFVKNKQIDFTNFMSSLSFELERQIHTDDIKQEVKPRMLVEKDKEKARVKKGKPAYGTTPYDYPGFDNYYWGSLYWTDLVASAGFHLAMFSMIDSFGHEMYDVGAGGIDMNESIFDEGADLSGLEDVGDMGIAESIGDVDTGGFFDSVGDSFGDFFDGFGGFD